MAIIIYGCELKEEPYTCIWFGPRIAVFIVSPI